MKTNLRLSLLTISLSLVTSLSAATPNIVIILVDDMGYGDLGCFNPESKIATPHLDALAAEGMRFTDAHAPGPLCHMSRYGLMTGEYPFRINVNRWNHEPLIAAGKTTIATLAKSQGYRTAMVGKWHVGFKENGYDKPLPGGPVDCGFDSYFGIRASTDIPPYFYIRDDKAVLPPSDHIEANNSEGWSPIQGAFWRKGGIAPDLKLPEVLPRFTDEALEVIQSHKKDVPLMMYLAYPAPHTPWLPSEEFNGKSGAGMYGDFVMMVDGQIGRVLKGLREAGMEDDTLVLFSSDNGPVWYDTDVERFGHDAMGPLRGMKGDSWEAGHRMPFIARWPGTVQAGTVSERTICFTDFLATFADITGAKLSSEAGPDSFSFLSALKGKKSHRPALVVRAGGSASMYHIRNAEWKLINALGSGGFSKPKTEKPTPGGPTGQLYNLEEDLGESNNLYTQYPERVEDMAAQLKRIIDAGRSRN
jgi:arylsulfatase A-like enzyme